MLLYAERRRKKQRTGAFTLETRQPIRDIIEDHALERVPEDQRHGWAALSWNTVGIVTTLVQIYVGAMLTFIVGMKIALLAGALVAVAGGFIGWGLGHIACRTGLASGVMARAHGFGVKGSVVVSAIFAFMIIGFIAAENALLYHGFLFYLRLEDSLANQVLIYGLFTLAWILLTAYGFRLVTRVSSIMVCGFLIVLFYMLFVILFASGQSWWALVSFDAQAGAAALQEAQAASDPARLAFAVNILAGSAGALALIDADLGRYARSSRDIGIAAFLGNFALDVFMIFMGGVIMYAGMPALIEHYVNTEGMSAAEARRIALENPDRVAAAFVIFGGALGAALMVLANAKAQVLNTYSASLSLANIMDAFQDWKPGRIVFVVVANLLSLLFLYGEIMSWFKSFLVILSVLTISLAGVMLADYFIAGRRPKRTAGDGAPAPVNLAGVITLALSFVLSHYLLAPLVPVEFVTALIVSLLLYPLLRRLLPQGAGAVLRR